MWLVAWALVARVWEYEGGESRHGALEVVRKAGGCWQVVGGRSAAAVCLGRLRHAFEFAVVHFPP